MIDNLGTKRTKNVYLSVFDEIKKGISPAKICLRYNTSYQRLQYYLTKLKEAGLIKKIGYGTWETNKTYDEKELKTTTPHVARNNLHFSIKKKIRGHAFVFKVIIPKIKKWKQRVKFLDKQGINYKNLKIIGGGQRIMFRHRKIWLTDKSIVIYEPNSFIADTSKGAKSYAIDKLLYLLKGLESMFDVGFSINGKYRFKVSRHHYARMKCELARQYNKENKKLNVYNEKGLWFLIDNSYNLLESETVATDTAQRDMDDVMVPFLNSLQKNPVTIDQVLSAIQQNAQNHALFAENLKSHIQAVKDLGDGVSKLTDTIIDFRNQAPQPNTLKTLKSKINTINDVKGNKELVMLLSPLEKQDFEQWLFLKFSIKA